MLGYVQNWKPKSKPKQDSSSQTKQGGDKKTEEQDKTTKQNTTKVIEVKPRGQWRADDHIIEGNTCPYAKPPEKIILIPLSLYKFLIDYEKQTHDEYLIYARLEETEDYIKLYEPVIPEQTVSSTHVDVEESVILGEKQAVIHRHPPGINSFSRTDYEYINRNNYLSILYLQGDFPDATIKRKLPCGKEMIVRFEPTIVVYFTEDWKQEYEELMKQAEENIEETYVYQPAQISRSYTYRGYSPYTYDYDDGDDIQVVQQRSVRELWEEEDPIDHQNIWGIPEW